MPACRATICIQQYASLKNLIDGTTHALIYSRYNKNVCSTYSVCKVNSVTPEVTFKRIIEQYKQLAGAGGGLSGGVGTPRLTVVKDILLERAGTQQQGTGVAGEKGTAGAAAGGGRRGSLRKEERGDIIKFYNKVCLRPAFGFAMGNDRPGGGTRG